MSFFEACSFWLEKVTDYIDDLAEDVDAGQRTFEALVIFFGVLTTPWIVGSIVILRALLRFAAFVFGF